MDPCACRSNSHSHNCTCRSLQTIPEARIIALVKNFQMYSTLFFWNFSNELILFIIKQRKHRPNFLSHPLFSFIVVNTFIFLLFTCCYFQPPHIQGLCVFPIQTKQCLFEISKPFIRTEQRLNANAINRQLTC